MNLDAVALLEPKDLNHGPRQPNSETVAPFCDLHDDLRDIQFLNVYPKLYCRYFQDSNRQPLEILSPGFVSKSHLITGSMRTLTVVEDIYRSRRHHCLLGLFGPLALAEPRATAVLVDEFDACTLEGFTDGLNRPTRYRAFWTFQNTILPTPVLARSM